jgi:hypothetical protein
MRPLDADPAEYAPDLPKAHADIIEPDRQLHKLAIRALALKKQSH